jgi:hypothetical protein
MPRFNLHSRSRQDTGAPQKDNLLERALQKAGAGAAYVREVPILGGILIGSIAFVGHNVRQGYLDQRAIIMARKAEKASTPAEMAEAAYQGLSPEDRDDLDTRAQLGGAPS